MAAEVTLRRASADDGPAIRAIADAEEEPPDAATGGFPDALDAYHLHLIEHGDVRLAVGADGEAVGFGAVIASSRSVHLADLFVRRAHQAQGIGQALLADLFGNRWPRTTFSSDDPRALPLYVRMGMRPLWPNLYLRGDGRVLRDAAGVTASPTDWVEVARLEAEWYGVDRTAQHRYWGGQPNAVPVIVRRGRRAVAAGYSRSRLRGEGRWISMFFVAPGASPVEPTLAALRAAAAFDSDGRIGACVPGPHPIVPELIGAGFRVIDRDTFQASDPGLVDSERWLVNTGIL